MSNKIWFFNDTQFDTKHPNIQVINQDNVQHNFTTIQSCIMLQKCHLEWSGMWTLEDAKERLNKGHLLYILSDKIGNLGHLWINQNYIYNVYVHPRRKNGQSEVFLKAVMTLNPKNYFILYCDDWNKRAQNFFKKVGFKEINSYLKV